MFKRIRKYRVTKLKKELKRIEFLLEYCCQNLMTLPLYHQFTEYYQHQKVILEIQEAIVKNKLKKLGE